MDNEHHMNFNFYPVAGSHNVTQNNYTVTESYPMS